MRLLLDTHVLLWWLDDDPRLSKEARAAIANEENVVYISAVSAWEIVIKRGLGKLDMPDTWAETVAREPFRRLPVTWDHALNVADLPAIHRDPFDRMLVVQAQTEDLTLVTTDPVLARYAIRVVTT